MLIFSLRVFWNFFVLNVYRRGLISELKLNSKVGRILVRVVLFCGDIVIWRFVVSYRNVIIIGIRKNNMLLRIIMFIFLVNVLFFLLLVFVFDFLIVRKIFIYIGIVMIYSRMF